LLERGKGREEVGEGGIVKIVEIAGIVGKEVALNIRVDNMVV
jgi:hypothetical protein